MLIKTELKREGARHPKYAKDLDVGADVFLPENFTLMPGIVNKVPLGIAVHIPQGFEGNLRPRSGTLIKRGITIHNPAIDPGYTGEIHAMVSIVGDEPVFVEAGDRICSLVITPFIRAQFVTEIINDRGDKGFNSTGA